MAKECEGCVKDDFNVMKGSVKAGSSWQTWAIRVLILTLIINSGFGGWLVYAKGAKDSQQDSRLTAVETNQQNILKNQDKESRQTEKLIELATQTNLLIQTHIARGN